MKKSHSVYLEIFALYSLRDYLRAREPKEIDEAKQRLRKNIRTKLKKEFPEYDWSDTDNWYKLSELERNRFKLVTVREIVLLEVRDNFRGVVENKLNEETNKVLIEANQALKEHNAYADIMSKEFNVRNASESEKRKAYEEFCTLYMEHVQPISHSGNPPTYEEWIKFPRRLIDYRDEAIDNEMEAEGLYLSEEERGEPTDAEIDHIALLSLIKYLEKDMSIRIDFGSIRECLINEQKYYMNQDLHLKKTDENLKMFDLHQKLDDLDFVEKQNGDSKSPFK